MDIQTLRCTHPNRWMRATAIRALTLDAVVAANSGHSGMPVAKADVATVLFSKHLKFCIDPVQICSCYEREGSNECDDGRQHHAVDGEA